MAANGDVVVAGELNHGVGNGVIDMAGRLLGAVPFHFVLERGGGEAGEKPVLVGELMRMLRLMAQPTGKPDRHSCRVMVALGRGLPSLLIA